MANEVISVIVPIYNVDKYLKRCIESIINQTYKNLEIILVDDGSTDMSGDICDRYARVVGLNEERVCEGKEKFEHSWKMFRGIHEYNEENNALKDIKEKFISYELNGEYNPMNLCIYKYSKPKYGIGCIDFYKHCEKNKK